MSDVLFNLVVNVSNVGNVLVTTNEDGIKGLIEKLQESLLDKDKEQSKRNILFNNVTGEVRLVAEKTELLEIAEKIKLQGEPKEGDVVILMDAEWVDEGYRFDDTRILDELVIHGMPTKDGVDKHTGNITLQ